MKSRPEEFNHFCILPWVHLHQWPNGDTFPCCVWDSNQPLGNANKNKLEDIWNSQRMTELRSNILKDLPTQGCSHCYRMEAQQHKSLRQWMLEKFGHHYSKLEDTSAEGFHHGFELNFIDFRFSNLCNFRCHTCSATLSSAWYEESEKLGEYTPPKKLMQVEDSESLWNQLKPHLNTVEMATFAGGEPLLMKQHSRILKHWLESGHTSVELKYVTNFSRLGEYQDELLEAWKHFPKLVIQASLDAAGPRAEYLRKGTRWKDIERNRKNLMRSNSHVRFELIPTVSAYNVFHLPDFLEEWLEREWVEPENIFFNFLATPERLGTWVLPESYRKKVIEKYQIHMENLRAKFPDRSQNLSQQYRAAIAHLELPGRTELLPEFLTYAQGVDRLRNENLMETFPELKGLTL